MLKSEEELLLLVRRLVERMVLPEFRRLLLPGELNLLKACSSKYFLQTLRASPCNVSHSSVRLVSTTAVQTQKELPHFKERQRMPGSQDNSDAENETLGNEPYRMPHPIWSDDDTHKVEITHETAKTKVDKLAYACVQMLRTGFDVLSLYKLGEMTESKWLTRIIMLETVAGVPGMIAAMARHFHSLRKLTRDHGWIHTLLEEAENERMHLMTALELKKPGILFRGIILLTQGIFVNAFFVAYVFSPRFCHRFVGYLEEEAVKTYTYCLKCIDDGTLAIWATKPAPTLAVNYWRLKEGAVMRDVILAIRADEAHHRVVNHTLSSMHLNEKNPFSPGEKKL